MTPIKYDDRRFGALSSSTNPQELSTTVESVMRIIGGLLAALGMSAVLPDVQSAADQVQALILLGVQITPLMYSAWNTAQALFGAIRKVFVFVYDKFTV